MSRKDWLEKSSRKFPKTVIASLDLRSSEIRRVFGQKFQFMRASYKSEGYCVFGFKDEATLTAFCKKFARHLLSEVDHDFTNP